jgi:hypothetical protein
MPAGDVFRRLVQGWHPMLSAVMVSRAALATARFDEDLRAYADYDLLLRLAAAGARFAGVGRAVLIRHEHHGQRAMTADAERLRAAVDVLDARWRQAIIDRTGRGSYRRWRARFDSAAEFVAVRNAVIRGERWTARRAAVRMARFLPWSVRFPALAAAAALLGPAGYDRLTRARDAMLRYRPG